MSNNILGMFDNEDIVSITKLIDKLEESSFDYLKLEGDGVKIVIGKKGLTEGLEGIEPATDRRVQTIVAPEVKQHPANTREKAVQAPESAQSAETVPGQTGIAVIKSPSYGLFYTQPEPGSPPYVKLGDVVKVGDTVGLLEIMKTFTAIISEVEGEIIQIYVKNEQVIEPDQPIYSVKMQ